MNSRVLSDLLRDLELIECRKPDVYKHIKYPDVMRDAIRRLDEIIGIEDVNTKVVEFIMHVIMEKAEGKFKPEENNIVITGPPGVGKSSVAYILGLIINSLSIPVKDNKSSASEEDSHILYMLKGGAKKGAYVSELDKIKKRNVIYQSRYQEVYSLIHTVNERLKTIVKKIDRSRTVNDLSEIREMLLDISNSYNVSIISSINKIGINIDESVQPEKSSFVNKYHHASRHDIVGSFVGSTCDKTSKLLDKCSGGVLFIDEAYSIVNVNPDTKTYGNDFGPEAWTEICNDITKHPGRIVYIIAGYKDLIKSNVFDIQAGLERRFNWWIDINSYSYKELYLIFESMLSKINMKIESPERTLEFFKDKYHMFNNFAGDCENMCKQIRKVINAARFKKMVGDIQSSDEDVSQSDTVISECLIISHQTIVDSFDFIKANAKLETDGIYDLNRMYI